MDLIPYNSRDLNYKSPFGSTPLGNSILFKIKPHRRYGVQKAYLIIEKDGFQSINIPLVWTSLEEAYDIYSCTYTPSEIGLYWYSFILETSTKTLFISRIEQGKGEITTSPGLNWQHSVYMHNYDTPEWLKGGIIYQIFPDRFNKAGTTIDNIPTDRHIRQDWGGLPDYISFETSTKVNNDYFCGNLKGITEKLDYLSELGISCIYLNPIFEAHSNHRYNTANYFKIDPLLGSTEDFRHLCEEAMKKNIRIILDGVFNHTGDDSIYFNRFGRYETLGAYQTKHSPYYDWFRFIDWPNEYYSWWGIDSLPETNKYNESFIEYINGEAGVLKYWLKEGAAGWRLDVVDEIPSFFVKQIRSAVKSENPASIIIGEVWEDASNKIAYDERRQYFLGNELDSVMNYPFKEGIISFLKNHNAVALNNCVMTILENYPKPVVDVLMNILGTHDTTRIITRLGGESSEGKTRAWKAKTWLTWERRQNALREVAIAATILYFLPGVPCIYYGDEIGLEGYEDPFNRRCFLWEETSCWLTQWFRTIGTIRRNHAVLQKGIYYPLQIKNGFYSFMRKGEDNCSIICAVNMDELPQTLILPFSYTRISLLACLEDFLGNQNNLPTLALPPKSCRIYQIE